MSRTSTRRRSSALRVSSAGRRTAAVVLATITVLTGVQLGAAPSAFSLTSNVLPSENPVNDTPRVLDNQALGVVQVGNRVVVGGNFTQIQDAGNAEPVLNQPNLFSFDATTGRIDTAFLPNVNGDVTAVVPHPDGDKVYVAGSFSRINGENHSRVALLRLSNGQPVASFDPPAISAIVETMKLVGGRLYIGGQFNTIGTESRTSLATLDPTTGALTNAVNSTISGTLQAGVGTTTVKSLDVSPNGSRLVAIGNFTTVDGANRTQMAMWDTSGATAVLRNWGTEKYGNVCNPVFPTYMRDVDFAPNGKFFVVVTTGSFRYGQLCDTAARWEVKGTGTTRGPTWVNWTGGDTITAVEVAGPMAFLGGHFRWLNNPFKGDDAGSGAWPTEGLATVDTRNGLPFSWNPGRDRGLGVFDFDPTGEMLWAVSDTNNWAGEYRPRLAGFPYAGGSTLPPDELGTLPGDVWMLGSASGNTDDQRAVGFDGTTVNGSLTEPGDEAWGDARGAFMVDDTVYTGWSDGTFTARTFDGTTFGTPHTIELYEGTTATAGYGSNFVNDLAKITGMFYDRGRARIYYTMQGSSSLYWRAFTPESEMVGAQRRILTKASVLKPAQVSGMFLAGQQLYFGDQTTGALKRVKFVDNKFQGSASVVNTQIDWRSRGLFLSSAWATLGPNFTPAAAFSVSCVGLDCTVDGAKSSDPDGGIVSYAWDFGDATEAAGPAAQRTFTDPGTYDITLTVTDNRGATATKTRSVTVDRLPNQLPSASFTVDCWGLDCDVDASASSDPDGQITSYAWDFGDGSSGSGKLDGHVFAANGTYDITLTVTDDRGGTDISSQQVTVNAIPTTITFRDSGTKAGVSSNPSITVPPLTQQGDLMLLFVSNGTSRDAVPNGWTQLDDVSDDDLRTQVFWRYATLGDLGSDVSVPLGGTASYTLSMAVYSGVTSPPVSQYATAIEGTSFVSSHTTPGLTVPDSGDWVVSYWADRTPVTDTSAGTTVWNAPGDQVVLGDAYSGGSGSKVTSLLTHDGAPVLSGARSGLTATTDVTTRKATMWTIVLRGQ